jgi:hypothetical protein
MIFLQLCYASETRPSGTDSNICVGEHSFEKFLIHNYLNQGNALLLLFFSCALECAIRKVQENRRVKMSGKC